MKSGKNSHFAKVILGRMLKNGLLGGWKLKCLKHAKNDSTKTLNLFYVKKTARKTLLYSKNDTITERGKNGHFAEAIVRQNAQKWPYFQFFDFDLSFKLQTGL